MGAKRTPDDALDRCHVRGKRILKQSSTCGGNAPLHGRGHWMTLDDTWHRTYGAVRNSVRGDTSEGTAAFVFPIPT